MKVSLTGKTSTWIGFPVPPEPATANRLVTPSRTGRAVRATFAGGGPTSDFSSHHGLRLLRISGLARKPWWNSEPEIPGDIVITNPPACLNTCWTGSGLEDWADIVRQT